MKQMPLDTIVLASIEDHGYSGKQRVVDVDENTVGIGGLLVLSADGSYDDADNDEDTYCSAIALESGTGSKLVGEPGGYMRDDSWAWTPGAILYVGEAGALTATPPSNGEYSQKVAIAITGDIIYFFCSMERYQTAVA
jgi:hypothetical protein